MKKYNTNNRQYADRDPCRDHVWVYVLLVRTAYATMVNGEFLQGPNNCEIASFVSIRKN